MHPKKLSEDKNKNKKSNFCFLSQNSCARKVEKHAWF